MVVINLIFLFFTSFFLLVIIFTSWVEKETRAVLFSSTGFLFNFFIWGFFIYADHIAWVLILNLVIVLFFFIFALVSGIYYFPERETKKSGIPVRFDERNHMFSRNNLKFNPHLFTRYYSQHPENKKKDQKIHQKAELGNPIQKYHDSLHSPLFEASFSYLDKIRPFSRGDVNKKKIKIESHELSQVIKNIARYYGAVDVGITLLRPYHFYSYAGRQAENWGEEIENEHKTAIVVVVAMDINMMKKSPSLPSILESSRQYVEAAKIANIIAEYLRQIGYKARAHTDGNYETLCVPLAVDSGLGELGRMGILVHQHYGPCVRLSVVTTELELVPTETKQFHIKDFCRMCKKCAENCPTNSIVREEEPFDRGFVHWSIDQEKCFAFWKNVGTDCGFCIRVCPYTKPYTLFHKLVRFYISRNPLNQRIALFFDDFLYGRKIPVPEKNSSGFFFTKSDFE